MELKVIKTRDGDLIPFDRTRIERVIEKATESVGVVNPSFVDTITDSVLERLVDFLVTSEGEEFITVEYIQDMVERELMESGHFDIMKHFIIYRNERIKERQKEKEKVEKKLESQTLKIIKTNGKKQAFDIEKVRNTYKKVSYKLARKCSFEKLSESLKKYIVEDMKTSDITKMMIKSAIDLISVENTSWQFIA
jgi:transcriptional regulator NrdR family protein